MAHNNNESLEYKLNQDINRYTADIVSAIRKAVDDRADEMYGLVQSKSPVRRKNPDYLRQKKYAAGSYKAGWHIKVMRDDTGRYLKGVVQSSDQKALTHLLDLGHDIVRNGKKVGSVAPQPHIQVAQKEVTAKLQQDINKILK